MRRIRVIPVLSLQGNGLVKTVKFKKPNYIGDPINAVKIFNEKEVDELIFLDITATKEKKEPNFRLIQEIATECFMPFCYGGGIRNLDQIKQLIAMGVEKVALNSIFGEQPDLVTKAAETFGNQSVVVSIDVKKNLFGKNKVVTHSGGKKLSEDVITYAKRAESCGAGEILINSVDRDGTYQGYDLELVQKVAENVGVPVVACGGAKEVEDFTGAVIQAGASAVSAGSMFVYHGARRAVLINFPTQETLKEKLFSQVK